MKGLPFAHLSVVEASSQFIPYSQRELVLIRTVGKLKAEQQSLGWREIKKKKKLKSRKEKRVKKIKLHPLKADSTDPRRAMRHFGPTRAPWYLMDIEVMGVEMKQENRAKEQVKTFILLLLWSAA